MDDGSSPRVRGTRAQVGASRRLRRFIPACAGNSTAGRRRRGRTPVHPRVCGELNRILSQATSVCGSSPRVRGTPQADAGGRAARRFIPACAGNSPPRPPAARCPPVHPRVCGELDRIVNAVDPPARFIPACAGNSPTAPRAPSPAPVHPRVCGELPRLGGGERASGRFIPACAGNSRSGRTARAGTPVHPRVCGELPALPRVVT